MKTKKHTKPHPPRRHWAFIVILILLIMLTGFILAFNPFSDRPVTTQPPIEHLINNLPTLLKQYTTLDFKPDYPHMKYQPRQFDVGVLADSYPDSTMNVTDPGEYKDWDFLTTLNEEKTLQLDFNRGATVGVVWFGENKPDWLADWKEATPIMINYKSYPVYKKVITQPTVKLKTSSKALFLFAEQNGLPSSTPNTPKGKAVPQPNQTCPTWVHEAYKAFGPDGKLYHTWHPQIDPVYWCYFHHEHGTDPSLFDKNYRIPFGYAGAKMSMHEAHVGFKTYVWDDHMGHLFLALQHQGTATNQAACGTMHELDIVTKDKTTNEIVSEQYFVGDYGNSRPIVTTDKIQSPKCPDEYQVSKNNSGVRFLPVKDHGAVMEEPWTADSHRIIGFNFADFTVNTWDPMRMCKDITCQRVVYTGQTGTNHTLIYVKGFGPKAGIAHSGVFYTDPMGRKLLSKDDPSAVQQYIKPGLSINSDLPYTSQLEAGCRDIYGTSDIMFCGKGLNSVPTAREDAIKIPN